MRDGRGSNLAEFGPAIWIFFLVFLFPLFNLVQFASAVATVFLIAMQAAQAAASAPDFQTGLTNARNTASALATSGLGRFAHLTPASPYGVNIWIDQMNIATKQQSYYGPDKPLAQAIDTNTYIYEIESRCLYDVGPMLPFQGVPLLSDIPLLGKSTRLSFNSQRAAEYPDGLSTVSSAP